MALTKSCSAVAGGPGVDLFSPLPSRRARPQGLPRLLRSRIRMVDRRHREPGVVPDGGPRRLPHRQCRHQFRRQHLEPPLLRRAGEFRHDDGGLGGFRLPRPRGLRRGDRRRHRPVARDAAGALARMAHRLADRALALGPALLPHGPRPHRAGQSRISHRRRHAARHRADRRLRHRAHHLDRLGADLRRRALGGGRIADRSRRRGQHRHPRLHGAGGHLLRRRHVDADALGRSPAPRRRGPAQRGRGETALRADAAARECRERRAHPRRGRRAAGARIDLCRPRAALAGCRAPPWPHHLADQWQRCLRAGPAAAAGRAEISLGRVHPRPGDAARRRLPAGAGGHRLAGRQFPRHCPVLRLDAARHRAHQCHRRHRPRPHGGPERRRGGRAGGPAGR